MNKQKFRIWWIPQIPMQPMFIHVEDLKTAAYTLHLLAYYDFFQFENGVKPDYSNTGGLEVFEDNEWFEWSDENGLDINDWMEENKLDYITWLNNKKEIEDGK